MRILITAENIFHTLLKKEVDEAGQVKTFRSGDVILNLNAYISSIPIILSGSIKVMQTDEEGKEILLYYIKPGESCIMSILAGIHNDKSKIKAIVEEDVELLLIPVDKAKQWIREFPEWTDFIFNLYQKRFEELLGVVNLVAFQKADIRLLNLLNQKSSLYKSREINITHRQLAEESGLSREAVSRVLKQMENEKLISIKRNKINLL